MHFHSRPSIRRQKTLKQEFKTDPILVMFVLGLIVFSYITHFNNTHTVANKPALAGGVSQTK